MTEAEQPSFIRCLRSCLGRVATALGVRPARRPDLRVCRGYIDARAMLRGAAASGMEVNEFIEVRQGWPGFVRHADDYALRLQDAGVLSGATRDVVEIGPGSGRHAAAILARVPGANYTAYEPDPWWRDHLAKTHGVRVPVAVGELLNDSPDDSVDLVHAVLTFVYLPFLSVVSYFNEAARVLRPGGFLHFDVFVEDSFTPESLTRWLRLGDRYPAVMPEAFMVALLASRGLHLVRRVPAPEHDSYEFLFRKQAGPPPQDAPAS